MWDHVDWLRAQGHRVTSDHVMPPEVQRITAAVAWHFLVRWPQWAWHFLRADRVLIQETLLLAPLMWLKRVGKKRRVVFDFSDPVDTIGAGLRNRLQRLGFAAMTRGADHVIVENAAYLVDLGNRGISASQFYGPVDVDRYQQHAPAAKAIRPADSTVRIGWTGSPGTLPFIAPLFPALDELARTHPIELMLIGVPSVNHDFKYLKLTCQPWNEQDEFRLVPSFDLGLFVLDGSERSKRRGAGKLFIYMAAGVPFVATDLGIAHDLMQESGVGFSVPTQDEWLRVLGTAAENAQLRHAMSEEGVDFARMRLSYQAFRALVRRILL